MIGRFSQLCLTGLRACSMTIAAVVVIAGMTAHSVAQSGPGGPGGGWGGGGGVFCPDVWDPVCGVDGNTYSNECYASVAGVEVAHKGACDGSPGGPVPIGGGWGGGWGGGFYCPDVWDPVCGVDGNTYSNECYASLAGVEVAHKGPCDGSPGGPVPISGGCPCPRGFYCYTPPGECDADPVCMPNTGFECLAVWDPVCGCDGNTYSNECYAALAGVSVASYGACGGGGGGPVPIMGEWTGGIFIKWCPCEWGQYCYTPPGECDADPVCMWRPDACLDVWDPVCGCDGNTYSNACYAAMAGVGVQYHDACDGGTTMGAPVYRLPDLNRDGVVDVEDLLLVLASMGPCAGCEADLTGSGEVDAHDVLLVLSAWGVTTTR